MWIPSPITNTLFLASDKSFQNRHMLTALIHAARLGGCAIIDVKVDVLSISIVNITLCFKSDGIDYIQNILSECKAIKPTQHANGLSLALYGAEFITINSKMEQLLIDCEAVLAGCEVSEPTPNPYWHDGSTEIRISCVKMPKDKVREHLASLAEALDVIIKFNGVSLDRPMSLSHLKLNGIEIVSTPFGELALRTPFSPELVIVWQGIKVFSRTQTSSCNVLHATSLDATHNDQLGSVERDMVATIDCWIEAHYASRLLSIRDTVKDDTLFLNQYFNEVREYSPQLLNDIPYLPPAAFVDLPYPCLREDYKDNWIEHSEGLTKGSNVLAVGSEVDVLFDPIAANFCYFGQAFILRHSLPSDHWFYDQMIHLENDMLKVQCLDAVSFQGECSHLCEKLNVVVAKQVSIVHEGSGLTVNVTNNAFVANCSSIRQSTMDGEQVDARIVISASDSKSMVFNEYLLLQLDSYEDEYGSWLDEELEQDIKSFKQQYLVSVSDSVEAVLVALLGKLPQSIADQLEGKSFNLHVLQGQASFTLNS